MAERPPQELRDRTQDLFGARMEVTKEGLLELYVGYKSLAAYERRSQSAGASR